MFRKRVVVALAIVVLSIQVSPSFAGAPTFQDWLKIISHTPTPGIGCFTVSYPSTAWVQVGCAANPHPEPHIVGGGGKTDWNGTFTKWVNVTTGSFTSETGFTSEHDNKYGQNQYTLQLNSNFYSTCVPNGFSQYCGKAWEQFLFDTNLGSPEVLIESWLPYFLKDNPSSPCPSQFPNAVYPGCFRDSQPYSTSRYTGQNLYQQYITGTAYSNLDTAQFCVSSQNPPTCYASSDRDYANLSQKNWLSAEFNVFGHCCGSQAVFNTGFSIRAIVDGNFPDFCVKGSSTGETNNLNLGSCSNNSNGYIIFSESD